jgi:formate hydrogenlyase subunit 6/NADH:ubiquinone oxidoreductase subunit I
MPVGIIPDISEQMCIGCALCVEICTTLGPDVLRVKPVEGSFTQKDVFLMVHALVYAQQKQSFG